MVELVAADVQSATNVDSIGIHDWIIAGCHSFRQQKATLKTHERYNMTRITASAKHEAKYYRQQIAGTARDYQTGRFAESHGDVGCFT